MFDPDDDPAKLLAKYEQGPEKKVHSHSDMGNWLKSKAYHDLIAYINTTSTAIQGIKNNDEMHISPLMSNLCAIFDKLEDLIEKNPRQEQPQRFGNKAYRGWSRSMYRDIYFMLEQAIPQEKCHSLNELGQYLSQSFGNPIRIDYGTGHELAFMFFLCALFKAKILYEEDIVAAALKLFNRYLTTVRKLQRVYNMEPAGSQGVWSLDDYQFVPFIWGSAQLCYNAPFEPEKFLDADIIEKYKGEYMFIGCIDYISKVKTGHFGEHSNQLWSITAVPSWIKINAGLVKMYQKEVLSKFPVIQHVYFSELMSFDGLPPGTPLVSARLGYITHKNRSTLDNITMPPPSVPPATPVSILTTVGSVTSLGTASKTTIEANHSSDSAMSTDVSDGAGSDSIIIRPKPGSQLSVFITDQSSVNYPLSTQALASDLKSTAFATNVEIKVVDPLEHQSNLVKEKDDH